MKTLLLTLVALVASAQTLDRYCNVPIPNERFTVLHGLMHLNGYWWQSASTTERQTYLFAWQDATGHEVTIQNVRVLSAPISIAVTSVSPRIPGLAQTCQSQNLLLNHPLRLPQLNGLIVSRISLACAGLPIGKPKLFWFAKTCQSCRLTFDRPDDGITAACKTSAKVSALAARVSP